jgi:predicted metalloprotease with PDZ domain
MSLAALCASLLLMAGAAAAAEPPLHYRVTLDGSPSIAVRVAWSGALPPGARFVVPRSVPMGYGEAPYDRYYGGMRGRDAQGGLVAMRRDAAMGPASPRFAFGKDAASEQGDAARAVALEYTVDLAALERENLQASDVSIARPRFTGLLGYSVFGFFEGRENQAAALEVQAPPGWPVFLTLSPDPQMRPPARAAAANFYELADSQVLAGPDLRVELVASAVPLYVATFAEAPIDNRLVVRLADEALRAVSTWFGGAPPFAHYTLSEWRIAPLSPLHAYDMGMEHLVGMTSVQSSASAPITETRRRLFYAHHMAHAWIPKRAYGTGYYPQQWEWAPLIDTIWFSEGFAQYAAIDAIAQSLAPAIGDDYRDGAVAVRFRETLLATPAPIARLELAELSRIASSRYSADFRLGMNVFARGGLMAVEMDALIRARSGGARSLRDALRAVVAWSAKAQRPFSVAELWDTCRDATGVDVTPVYERWKGAQPASF